MIRALATAGLAAVGFVSPSLPSTAFAVDIVNQDDTPYFLIIVAAGAEQGMVVGARAGLYDVCAGCIIRIDGIGDVRAVEDASTLVIAGRQARLERDPPAPPLPAPWGGLVRARQPAL